MSEHSSPPHGGTDSRPESESPKQPGINRLVMVGAGGFFGAAGGQMLTSLVDRGVVVPEDGNSPFSQEKSFAAPTGRDVRLQVQALDVDPKIEQVISQLPSEVAEVILANTLKGNDKGGRLDGTGRVPELAQDILRETDAFEAALKDSLGGDPCVAFVWASSDGGFGSGTLRELCRYINEDHIVDRRLNEPTIVAPVVAIPHYGDAFERRTHPGYESGTALDNVHETVDLLEEEIGRAFDLSVIVDNDLSAMAAYANEESLALPELAEPVQRFRKDGDFGGMLEFDDSAGEATVSMEMADRGIADAIFPLVEMPLQPENISFGKTSQAGFDSGDFRSSIGNQFVVPGYTEFEEAADVYTRVPDIPDSEPTLRASVRGAVHYAQIASTAPFLAEDVQSVKAFVAVPGLEPEGLSQRLRNQVRRDLQETFSEAESITVNNVSGLTQQHFGGNQPAVACWTLVGLDKLAPTVEAKWGDA